MRIKTVGQVAAFVILCLFAAAALLLLFPGAKEGFSLGEWPILAAAITGLIVVGVIWWFIVGRAFWPALLGWAVLAVPVGANGLVAWALFDAQLEGRRIAQESRIESFRETPIRWPGFDGPVGWQIDLTLRHPPGVKGLILAPEIRFGPEIAMPRDRIIPTMTVGAGYFKKGPQGRKKHPLTLLKTVLFQTLYAERFTGRRFDPNGLTKLRYYLYPGTVALLESKSRLCLASHSAGIPKCAAGAKPHSGCAPRNRQLVREPTYDLGGDLTALWAAAGAYDLAADLSAPLTAVLRKSSRLQGKPKAWRAMQKRIEPAGLKRAGYKLCPAGQASHTASRTCYCKGS